MIYEASHGIIVQPPTKFINGAAIGLPLLAGALLLVGLFSSHDFGAAGKHPTIAAKKPALALSIRADSPHAGPATASANTFAPTPSTPVTSGQISGVSGGMGGGAIPSDMTAPTATPTSAGTTPSTSLLPASVAVPPVDVQAAGKQVISTSGTSLTLN